MSKDKSKQKASSSERKSRFLARLWTSYYPFLILLVLYLVNSEYGFLCISPLSISFHGIYWIYVAKKAPRHFILMMLYINKYDIKDAKSWYSPYQIKEWQREARKYGLFEIIFGIVSLLFLLLLKVYS